LHIIAKFGSNISNTAKVIQKSTAEKKKETALSGLPARHSVTRFAFDLKFYLSAQNVVVNTYTNFGLSSMHRWLDIKCSIFKI